MKADESVLKKFKNSFLKEYRLALSDQDAELALQNLTDFFALLYQFDLDDKKKAQEQGKEQLHD